MNPAYAPDLCLVYLSHIYMLPEGARTVLHLLGAHRAARLAVRYLHATPAPRRSCCRRPTRPGATFGMRVDLACGDGVLHPEDRLSLQRILFYGRGGFDAIDPRHFPYRQPDFRDPKEVAATGDRPVPFMLLLRRVGREREARLPIDEAKAVMQLLYDDFATFCEPNHLASSLDVVLGRLEERRAKGKNDVALLPLPTGAQDLRRLKPLFRYDVYRRHYGPGPGTDAYLKSGIAETIAANPHWLDEQLARIAEELAKTRRFVYASRDKGFDPEAPEEPSAAAGAVPPT